jgi:hypothetical protein
MFKKKLWSKGCHNNVVVLHMCISGMIIPPMVIFEGARKNVRLAETPMTSLVRDLFA